MATEFELTGKVVGDLKPGDVVVVKVGKHVKPVDAKHIRHQMEQVVPKGVKVVIHDDRFEIDVLRPLSQKVDLSREDEDQA